MYTRVVGTCLYSNFLANYDLLAAKKSMGACRMKLTVSDKPLRHGLELLLLLVQSQRSLCYWVALKQRGQTLFTQRHMCKSHNQELQL